MFSLPLSSTTKGIFSGLIQDCESTELATHTRIRTCIYTHNLTCENLDRQWRTALVPSLLLSDVTDAIEPGKCVRCVCVRSRQPCVSCIPGDDGCHNRPSSRPASTTPMPPDTASHASSLLPPTVSLSGAPATVHPTPLTPPHTRIRTCIRTTSGSM